MVCPISQSSELRLRRRPESKNAYADVFSVTYGLRSYSPVLGRWINRDPIGEQGGVNLSCFVQNKSTNNFDILGYILGFSCKPISEPTAVKGAKWKFKENVDLDVVPADQGASVYGATAVWELEGEVKCCCKIPFFSWTKTKKVKKTVKIKWRLKPPAVFWKPGQLPVSVPSPATIAQGLGEVLGGITGNVLGVFSKYYPDNEYDADRLKSAIAKTKPSSVDEGDWPENPCE